jgi:hypothetical protein
MTFMTDTPSIKQENDSDSLCKLITNFSNLLPRLYLDDIDVSWAASAGLIIYKEARISSISSSSSLLKAKLVSGTGTGTALRLDY